MNSSFRKVTASAALLAVLWTAPATLCPTSAHAAAKMTTTAGVNVRSGPGIDQAIIGGLKQGTTIEALGPSQNGWTPISYQGRTAYISSSYLSGAGSTYSNSSTRTTTAPLNVRQGPGAGYAVIRVLSPNTAVNLTGEESNGFAKMTDGGWVSTSYLTSPVTTTPITPGTSGSFVATTAVNFRSGPSTNDSVIRVLAEGTAVQATGKESNGFTEITVGGSTGWVHKNYLRAAATPPAPTTPPTAPTNPTNPNPGLPAVTGTRYATVALNVRPTAGFTNNPVGFVPAGTALSITGAVQDEWTQIIWSGATRWVYTAYLSATPVAAPSSPSVGLEKLIPSARKAMEAVKANFPQLTTYYGVRPDGPGADHTDGRAVDFMIPNYRNNHELGQAVANYLQAHAAEFDIRYLIWEQRIWLADYPQQGWTWMADRGSDTQNHYDHVHLSVRSH
ncbi:MAG: SH3 domain-containing protein [Propionibacteriaceae bacterium]